MTRPLPTARFTAAALLGLALAGGASANDYAAQIQDLYQTTIAGLLADPAIVAAVKAQNDRTAALGAPEIDALDKTWRAEVKTATRPMVDGVVANPVADLLRTRRDASAGLFTEIFVMDAQGLNVAASDPTSDYWQGDEAKWQETYAKGPGALHISEVEFDESTKTYQAQVSAPILDPATGAPIGAATFGIDVGQLN